MIREGLAIYRWMWTETRRRSPWPVPICLLSFGSTVIVDLGRAGWLSLTRAVVIARRHRHALADLSVRSLGAAAFCLLLFGPVFLAFGAATRTPDSVPGQLRVLTSGMLDLDGRSLAVGELTDALEGLQVVTLRIELEEGASAGMLGRVRSAVAGTSVRTLHLASVPTSLERAP